MKSCVTGLSVRFFKVTIPTGTLLSDCWTGKAFNSGRLVENLNMQSGIIEIKRPVARRLILTSGEAVNTVARG